VEIDPEEHDTSDAVDELAGEKGAAAQPPPPVDPVDETAEPVPTPAPRPSPTAVSSASVKPALTPPPKPNPSGTSSAAASASSGAASGDAPPTPGDGDGHAKKAPDLAARFTKELPAYAYPVAGWEELADGQGGSISFTITLDDRGKIVREGDPIPSKPPPPPALAESIRRTLGALRMTLALPGQPVRAGKLTVKVSASVVHGSPRPDIQKFRIESKYEKRTGRAEFELESGLLVTFDVVVESVAVD
jgi:hypothetical protein